MALRGVLAREQHLGFQLFQIPGKAPHLALDIGVDVFAFASEFEQCVQVGGQAGDLGFLGDLLFQALAILHDLLALFGVGPEIGSVDLFFDLG